jgi:hypothetical protein
MPSRLANSTPATSRTFDRRFTMPSRMGSANAVKIDTSSLVDEFTPHVKGLRAKMQSRLSNRYLTILGIVSGARLHRMRKSR